VSVIKHTERMQTKTLKYIQCWILFEGQILESKMV